MHGLVLSWQSSLLLTVCVLAFLFLSFLEVGFVKLSSTVLGGGQITFCHPTQRAVLHTCISNWLVFIYYAQEVKSSYLIFSIHPCLVHLNKNCIFAYLNRNTASSSNHIPFAFNFFLCCFTYVNRHGLKIHKNS